LIVAGFWGGNRAGAAHIPGMATIVQCNYVKRPKRLVSRTRLVMGLLLIVAIPIFIGLANKAVHENAEAIQQSFGR
jgi:hypothetical protein